MTKKHIKETHKAKELVSKTKATVTDFINKGISEKELIKLQESELNKLVY